MLLWLGLLIFFQGDVPFKANDEFELKLDFQIKARPYLPSDSDPKIDFSPTNNGLPDSHRKAGSFPHITFKFKFLKLSSEEVKVKISDSAGTIVYNKKAKVGTIINLEMGFIKDIKEGIVPNEYDIVLISDNKKPTSHIQISVQKDGTYVVNNMINGKF